MRNPARLVLSLLLMATPAVGSWGAHGPQSADRSMRGRKVVFFFFVRGTASRKYERAELQEMQKGHIGNLERLHRADLLTMAGPCADPSERRRGIVLMAVPDRKDLEKHFEQDPFVREGLLKIEGFRGEAPICELGTPAEKGMDQHSVVVFEQTDATSRPIKADGARYAALPADKRPAVAVVAREAGPVRMVLFFRTPDVEDVKALVEADPLVTSGKLKALVYQQWLGKGTLKDAQ